MAKTEGKSEKKDSGKQNGGPQQPPAANLPLFYKQPEPLDAKKHSPLSLKRNFGFDFTKTANAVPVNLIEMDQIANSYPIAFSPDGNATPVAILGLRDNENLFVDSRGQWSKNTYIPAYIRRYPFIFSEMPTKDQLTLCVDMDESVVEKGSDRPFFEKDGSPSQLSKDALEFCKSYHAAAQQTLDFSKALVEKDLLGDSRGVRVELSGNRVVNFSGFRIIDKKKLDALDDKTFLEFRKRGWIPYIYAHLFSGANWHLLSQLLNERLEKEAA